MCLGRAYICLYMPWYDKGQRSQIEMIWLAKTKASKDQGKTEDSMRWDRCEVTQGRGGCREGARESREGVLRTRRSRPRSEYESRFEQASEAKLVWMSRSRPDAMSVKEGRARHVLFVVVLFCIFVFLLVMVPLRWIS